ncbi:MAG: TraR/DksA C4-type zinc finger protein [Ilumatobacteraceae bacterium]
MSAQSQGEPTSAASGSQPTVPPESELDAELHRAIAQVRLLEPEYEQLLADPGVIQEDRDGARRLLEIARANVESAQRAVERAEAGTYGLCTVCHGPIGDERLAALPDVDMCVACQAAR